MLLSRNKDYTVKLFSFNGCCNFGKDLYLKIKIYVAIFSNLLLSTTKIKQH